MNNRDEILKRVFSNSGLTEFEEGYPSSTLPSPSELYPYSEAKAPGEPLSMQTMQDVSPAPAEWFGGKTGAGGIALPLPMPSLTPELEPAYAPAAEPATAPATSPATQPSTATSPSFAPFPFPLPFPGRNANPQTGEGLEPVPVPVPEGAAQPVPVPEKQPEGLPQRVNAKATASNAFDLSRVPQTAPQTLRDTIDISQEYPEAAQYYEPANAKATASNAFDLSRVPQTAPQIQQMEVKSRSLRPEQEKERVNAKAQGQNAFDLSRTEYAPQIQHMEVKSRSLRPEPAPVRAPVYSGDNVDAISTAAPVQRTTIMNPATSSASAPKSFFERMWEYQANKNEAFVANPVKTLGTEAAASVIAAPAIAAAPAVGGALGALGKIGAALGAGSAALPAVGFAESTWNPTTQKYTQPVNNKASATKAPAPTASVSTTASDAVKSLSNLASKLNTAIKGLNVGR